MTEYAHAPCAAGFKDRSLGLVLFGIVAILIGGVCVLLVPCVLLSATAAPAGGAAANFRMMIPAVAFYALLAAAFIWIGIGSILARRWARALMLVLSWLWLICGTVGMILVAVLMPGMFEQIGQQGPPGQQIPPQVMTIVLIITGGIVSCIYIFLPGTFILFYRSRHVKATCEFKDPHTRWTDKCPLPVLALSILMGFLAYSMIWAAFYGSVFPLFGVLVNGAPGAAVVLLMTCLLGYLTWGIYRLRISAWWGTFGLMIFWAVSGMITFSRVGLVEMYQKMGFPEEQLELLRQMGIVDKSFTVWSIGIGTAVWLGFLLYLKRYFVSPSD